MLRINEILKDNKNAIICGIRFAIACLLGFIFYHAFDLQFGYWAVVTISAVMQPFIKLTTQKAWLRLFGTLIGVVLGFLSVIMIKEIPHSLLVIFFISMFISGTLIFFNRRYSYLGIVCGITVIIILTTYNEFPNLLYNVSIIRTIDVITGILIAWLCSVWIFPGPEKHPVLVQKDTALPAPERIIFKHSFIMALATTLSLVPWFSWHYSGGFWAPISCLFIVEENLDKTQEKGMRRFLAHVIVVIIALQFSFFLGTTIFVGIALICGMFLFGFWMIKPPFGFDASTANTMAIAYAIVLLVSPGQVNTISTALSRFTNTVIGIAIGLIIVHIIHKKLKHRRSKAESF